MKDQTSNEYSSGAGCLLRLYWIFAGPALLAVAFAFLLQKHPAFPSFLDAGCLFAVIALVVVRYIDIRCFKGGTGEGNPATMKHWRAYSIALIIGSLSVWLIIRFLGPLSA